MKMRFVLIVSLLAVIPSIRAHAVTPAASLAVTSPSIELVGVVRIGGGEHDLSGLDYNLEDGSPADSLGGFSAIEYSGEGNRFLLLPDRGAGDGAVAYPCRLHEADLVVDPVTKSIRWKLITTKQFTSPSGEPLVGSLVAHDADLHSADKSHWTAFDPEGIRRLADGSLVISDEYGPHLVSVDASARITSEYPIPDSVRLVSPVDGQHIAGTFPNRGLEGVAVTPSGNTTVAVFQSPLIQDGRLENDKCLGLNCRWLIYNHQHACEREIVYELDGLSSGVSEILAIDESRFLVLERDSKSGEAAKIKKIFMVDIGEATDVMNIDSLLTSGAATGVRHAKKTLFLDLLEKRFGLGGERAHEKPEGLCWGQPLPDGRRSLWVCCDNDFNPANPSEIYCFAIDETELCPTER